MYICRFAQKGVYILEVLNKIVELLKSNNIKQKELADYLSLSSNVFTEWKAGRNTSYMKHLPKIAEFFGVSVDYLLGNENSSVTNDFTYALYNEITHDLSQDQIDQLKKYADFLRNS